MRAFYAAKGGNPWRKPEIERAYRERTGSHRKRYPETARAADMARRARKLGANYESFKPVEIYDRDGWVCGVCHRKVRRDLAYPHPRSPSLDHVVPLSKGGEHTRSNARLAHFDCNVSRGNRGGGEQLAFIG